MQLGVSMTPLKPADLQAVAGGMFQNPFRRQAAPRYAAPARPAAAQAANVFPPAPQGAPPEMQAMVDEANQYAATHQPNGSQYAGNDGGSGSEMV